MWRWSHVGKVQFLASSVFSTYVEVILTKISLVRLALGILHVCGGDPKKGVRLWKEKSYSPRMWRWSLLFGARRIIEIVFSTYVEVILYCLIWPSTSFRILHVCGGDPIMGKKLKNRFLYSPRMWRWSQDDMGIYTALLVFSTYVEVIPGVLVLRVLRACILHVCGGDPRINAINKNIFLYSPRMWRWS